MSVRSAFIAATVSVALAGGITFGVSAIPAHADDNQPAHIVRITGSEYHGFKIRYSDGHGVTTPALSRLVKSCHVKGEPRPNYCEGYVTGMQDGLLEVRRALHNRPLN